MLSYLLGVITGSYQMKDVILQLCVIVCVLPAGARKRPRLDGG